MKNRATAGLTVIVAVALNACGTVSSADLESFEERSSYAVGVDIGNNLKRTAVEFEVSILLQGIADVLEDREVHMTNQEIGEVLQELSTHAQSAQRRQHEEAAERNTAEGQGYLAENGQRDGVTTTESGLQYEVIALGGGPRPSATDQVSVNYRGTLVDGTEFDSSYERGEPATFAVGGVIPGWTEVLQLMPVGSKYRVVVPSHLAYGERGAGADIGPNATLIFEVELLAIVVQ